jgi:hypothetical protein
MALGLRVQPARALSFAVEINPANPVVSDQSTAPYTGCAWIDYDDDGLLDLFLADSVVNVLYHNEGGGVFTRVVGDPLVTDSAWGRGTSWADFDNDGDLDCMVSGVPSVLFSNDGDGTFTKVTTGEIATEDNRGWGSACGDNDGDVDMVISHPSGFVGGGPPVPNQFFRNDGAPNYQFTKIDTGVISMGNAAYTTGTWSDFDQDGDLDCFMASGPASSQAKPDFLYNNLRSQTGLPGFERLMTDPIATDSVDGQVMNWIDIDNDGDLDLFRTNWGGGNTANRPNNLYRNDSGTYVRITTGDIVTDAFVSMASVWGDYDNDGDLDCFVTNDFVAFNNVYSNNGDGTFTKVLAGDASFQSGSHYGATAGDYDNDGDLDLFVAGRATFRHLLRNTDTSGNHWVKIRPEGIVSNRRAIGARVRIKAVIGGVPTWQVRETSRQNSFMSHSSLRAHFGLGDATLVDSLRIDWPSGGVTVMEALAVDTLHVIDEVCIDPDGDGATCVDNCPDTANASQADADLDGRGDLCDNCPNDANYPQSDTDADGVGDACDNCPEDFNPLQEDGDTNGIGDACDCQIVITGDLNLSGALEAADIIASVNFVFKSGPTPQPCEAAGDVNCSGSVTASDIVYIVGHVFKGGPESCDVCTLVPSSWSCD